MSNPFLLVIILFESFGSIHSQHPICKVDDIKIESVIDINSIIKYFVTFDGAYKYWLWNEEDVTKQVGQNLTSKQAFGYGNFKSVKIYLNYNSFQITNTWFVLRELILC